MKRYIALLFSLFMIAICSISINAADNSCGYDATWEYDSSSKTLYINGEGDIDNITYEYNQELKTGYVQPWFNYVDEIENVVINEGISSIGENVFREHSKLKNVTIPDSLLSIHGCAFYWCSSLERITLPASVTYINPSAFIMCNNLKHIIVDSKNECYTSLEGVLYDKPLTSLICYPSGKEDHIYTLPDSVYEIGDYAFFSNSILRKVNLPDSLEYIGYAAFNNTYRLEELTIPAATWYIGDENFMYCENLKKIDVDKNNKSYSSEDGVLFDKEKTKLIIFPCRKIVSEYYVPDTVERIMPAAFYLSKIETITLPQKLKSIGYEAFGSCYNLETIYIPESIEILEWSAFYDCMNLTEIYFFGDLPYGDNPEYYDTGEEIPLLCLEDIIYSDYSEINIYYLYNKKGWNTLDKAYLKDLGINLIPFSLSDAEADETETEAVIWGTVVSTDNVEERFESLEDETPETILNEKPKEIKEDTSSQNNFLETITPYLPYAIIVIVATSIIVIVIVLAKKNFASKKQKAQNKRVCSKCGFIYGDDMEFCAKCGTPYTVPKEEESKSTCPECGFELEEGTLFCGNCGRKIT